MFRRPVERSDASESGDKAALEQQEAQLDEIERLRVPVFLNRNRRKMKQLRKNLQPGSAELILENGLVIRQVPILGKLQFDADTYDFMMYKRKRVSSWTEEQRAKTNYEAQQRFDLVRENQRQRVLAQLASESGNSEERMASDEHEHE